MPVSPQQSKPTEDEPIATDSEATNVIAFAPRPKQVPAEPLFSDEERAQLRLMLQEFQTIKRYCPMAKELTDNPP